MLNVDLNISCWRFLYAHVPCFFLLSQRYIFESSMVNIGGAIFNDDVQLVISISFFTSIETIE